MVVSGLVEKIDDGFSPDKVDLSSYPHGFSPLKDLALLSNLGCVDLVSKLTPEQRKAIERLQDAKLLPPQEMWKEGGINILAMYGKYKSSDKAS